MTMNSARNRKSAIDVIAVVVLFGAFFITTAMTVLYGVAVYSKQNIRLGNNANIRTADSYIRNKVKSLTPGGRIELSDFSPESGSSSDVITLHNSERTENGEVTYTTYIYVYDRRELRELTVMGDSGLVPEAGKFIADVESMQCKRIDERLMCIELDYSWIISVCSENGAIEGEAE